MNKEDFYNTKIYVKNSGESEAVQKKLFEMGFRWASTGTTVNSNYKHIFIDEDNILTMCEDNEYFMNSSKKLVLASSLISWKERIMNNKNKHKWLIF